MDYNCSDKIYFSKKEDPLIISDDIENSEQALLNNAIVNDKMLFNKTDALKLELEIGNQQIDKAISKQMLQELTQEEVSFYLLV